MYTRRLSARGPKHSNATAQWSTFETKIQRGKPVAHHRGRPQDRASPPLWLSHGKLKTYNGTLC